MLLMALIMGGDTLGGGFGYFTVGYYGADMGNINEVLAANGFPRIGNGFLSRGGHGYGVIGRILIGGGGFGLGEKSVRNGNTIVRVSGGGGGFEFGYMVLHTKNFFLFPRFLLGAGGWDVVVASTDPVDMGEVFSGNYREVDLSGGSYMIGVGLLGVYRAGPFILTLSGGYNFTQAFYLNGRDYDVRNTPQMTLKGLYFGIGIGSGYIGG